MAAMTRCIWRVSRRGHCSSYRPPASRAKVATRGHGGMMLAGAARSVVGKGRPCRCPADTSATAGRRRTRRPACGWRPTPAGPPADGPCPTAATSASCCATPGAAPPAPARWRQNATAERSKRRSGATSRTSAAGSCVVAAIAAAIAAPSPAMKAHAPPASSAAPATANAEQRRHRCHAPGPLSAASACAARLYSAAATGATWHATRDRAWNARSPDLAPAHVAR
mmetsp:Transcript_139/g.432  ORF Transcript_139/g.432 Transcript_139/m.432 type:complete len:225 (+) Transcript_139:562-1236(+)